VRRWRAPFFLRSRPIKQRGTWTDPQFARTLFEEWAKEYWRTKLNRRASTKLRDDSYIRNHVMPTFGRVPLGTITQPDVRAWIEKLVKKGLARPPSSSATGCSPPPWRRRLMHD
jgi:Phage integrase, N-terminal SAM-like domain